MVSSSAESEPRAQVVPGIAAVVLGINRFMGLRASSKPNNPHGLALRPADDQSDMHGLLHQQGSKINLWQQRYFVLQGSTVASWDDEAAARLADPGACQGVGIVRSVRRWQVGGSQKKPAQIAEKTWLHHAACGFIFATGEREYVVYADSADMAERWVSQLTAAVERAEGALAKVEASSKSASSQGSGSTRILSRLYEIETPAHDAFVVDYEETGDIRRQVRRQT